MENITWFEKWYAEQSYKNFGKKIDIQISTIENSAWKVKFDLKNTKLSKLKVEKIENFNSKFNWFEAEIKNQEFVAKGDFTKLSFLIGQFRSFIGEQGRKYSHKNDYFFDYEIQTFMLENNERFITFLHYTNSNEAAKKIIKTGLKFSYSFDKTTKKVKSNSVDLNYNHYVLKQFGDNVIVICISVDIYQKYLDILKNSNTQDVVVEEILTESTPYLDDDSEKIFTLSNKFVKGYFNYRENEIYNNPEFNPNFDSDIFLKNIKKLTAND
ncbi:MAG: hypothetical protein JXA16_03745 [Bacteroidales bacterium]|nr:hypothetical protein [Bacteroidales bacterium]HES59671.1 hypothetical protein [Caldithrix sp.]